MPARASKHPFLRLPGPDFVPAAFPASPARTDMDFDAGLVLISGWTYSALRIRSDRENTLQIERSHLSTVAEALAFEGQMFCLATGESRATC
jgi:hypothetical protein